MPARTQLPPPNLLLLRSCCLIIMCPRRCLIIMCPRRFPRLRHPMFTYACAYVCVCVCACGCAHVCTCAYHDAPPARTHTHAAAALRRPDQYPSTTMFEDPRRLTRVAPVAAVPEVSSLEEPRRLARVVLVTTVGASPIEEPWCHGPPRASAHPQEPTLQRNCHEGHLHGGLRGGRRSSAADIIMHYARPRERAIGRTARAGVDAGGAALPPLTTVARAAARAPQCNFMQCLPRRAPR